MNLGIKVKALREEREMNQKDLAVASKITQATISRIEKGQVKQLKSEALKRLAEALRVTVDYLVGTMRVQSADFLPEYPMLYLEAPGEDGILVKNFHKLPAEVKRVVMDFVLFLVQQEKERRKKLDEKVARLEASGKKR